MHMTSLKDVAQLAGVSPSTVSYYLNGKKRVRLETAERIQAAVRKLNYQPNLIARSLKMRVTHSVGIVVSDLSNIFYLDILSGMENVLRSRGYSSIVSNSRSDGQIEKENLRELTNRNIDGVILLGTGQNVAPKCSEYGVPIVSVDRIGSEETYTVSVDNVQGGYLGMKYLIRKGKKKVAFIGFPQRISLAERYEGCKKACVEAGLDPEESLIYFETQISPEHGYKAVMDLFYDGRLDTCDAIFAGADFVAYGALKALHDLDIDVPGQIGLIGFDDLALSQFTIPALTTVQQPRFEIGEKAAYMLLDMIDKKDAINSVKLKPVLVVRDSV